MHIKGTHPVFQAFCVGLRVTQCKAQRLSTEPNGCFIKQYAAFSLRGPEEVVSTTEHVETIPLPCLPETQRYDQHWRQTRAAFNV